MPPKRGISQEEKKTKLLAFFNSSHNFYTLKELEKDAAKYTKVSPMLIKDLLTELIDDGLVNMEKCGTTNLYWCFKYDRVKNLIKDQENVEKKIEVRLKDKISLIEQIQAAKLLRKKKSEFGDRDKLLGKLKRLQLRKKDLEPQMQAIDENDPEKLEKIYKHNLKLKDGIDFFTETIEEMIYYFTKVAACPVDEKSLRGELDIPIEFEDTSQVML